MSDSAKVSDMGACDHGQPFIDACWMQCASLGRTPHTQQRLCHQNGDTQWLWWLACGTLGKWLWERS
eukprot:357663-Amphidinium_carterae.1